MCPLLYTSFFNELAVADLWQDHYNGYLEKPVSLAFRGTLRGLSIGVGG